MSPLRSLSDYEWFVYSLRDRFPSVVGSTLRVERRGISLARVSGELECTSGFRIVVRERLVCDRQPAVIDEYGYEIWCGDRKVCWYDSQPHPDDPSLQSTHPHHKHVHPDIKRNRIVAPEMSFTTANLPALIHEVERLGAGSETPPTS